MYSRYMEVNLTFNTGKGVRKLVMRQPSDTEWMRRINSRYTLIKGADNNTKSTVVGGGESDLVLMKGILKVEPVPELDMFEATAVVDALIKATVVDCESFDGAYSFSLEVLGGETTTHMIKIPSVEDLTKCAGSSTRTARTPYGVKFIQNYQAAQDLYNKYIQNTTGYGPKEEGKDIDTVMDVPVTHKFVIADALHKQVMDLKVAIAGAEDDIFS